MIIKTDKSGKELESWPTVEDAAKAIKLAPAVLKSHMLKRKPKLLGGFVFKEVHVKFTQSTGQIETLEEGTGSRRFWKTEELSSEIDFKTATPEAFDGPPLPNFTADEPALFATAPAVMLDEFGDPVQPEIPEEAYGYTGVPPEIADYDLAYLDKRLKALEEPVDPEELANLLRTPLQRRLHELNQK